MGVGVRTQPSLWAVWPTLAATWVAFAHVISFQGLAIWVIGGSILTALAVYSLAHLGRKLFALALMFVVPIVVAGAADFLGGDNAGPITRSALMASAVTAAMCVILASSHPQLILVPSVCLLGGALGLGAADQVLWLVGIWVVAAALTLSMLGPYRQEHLRERAQLVPFAAMLSFFGLVGVGALLILSSFINQPWTIPGSGALDSGITPSVVIENENENENENEPLVGVAEVSTADTESVLERIINWLVIALLVLLLLILLWLVGALIRRLWSSLRWWWVRVRLRRGPPTSQIIGAWTWVRLRRMRYDSALPVWMSPDIAADWGNSNGDPDLALVALNASHVYFGRGVDGFDLTHMVESTWSAARRAGIGPRASLRRRWMWWARGPRVSDLYCVSATS